MNTIEEVKNKLQQIYCLEVLDLKLIADKGEKQIWQVFSNRGKKLFKKIPISENRAKFITGAAKYLIKQGMEVPSIIQTGKGEDYYLSPDQKIYLLTDWIEGSKPNFNDCLENIIKALAKFHKCSQNFNVNIYPTAPDRRGTWVNTYRKRQWKLLEMKITNFENHSAALIFLQNINYFLNKAYMVQKLLEQSYYFEWVQKSFNYINLCHRDFVPQNLKLKGSGELFVFDFDTLTVELPAYDLRKIINNICKRKQRWDPVLVKSIISYYNSVNPLSYREWEVVFIDLMFPHLFYSLLHSYCLQISPGQLNNCNLNRLEKVIEFERSKDNILENLTEIVK